MRNLTISTPGVEIAYLVYDCYMRWFLTLLASVFVVWVSVVSMPQVAAQSISADLTGDGVVDVLDIRRLVAEFPMFTILVYNEIVRFYGAMGSDVSFDFDTRIPSWSTKTGSWQFIQASEFGSRALEISPSVGTVLELPVPTLWQQQPDNLYEVRIDAYDDGVSPYGLLVGLHQSDTERIAVGISPGSSEYYYRIATAGTDSILATGLKRSKGIHRFSLRISPYGAYGAIDGVAFSFIPWAGNTDGVSRNLTKPIKLFLSAPWGSTPVRLDNLALTKHEYSSLLRASPAVVDKHFATLLLQTVPNIYTQTLANTYGYSAMAQLASLFAFEAHTQRGVCSPQITSATTSCDKMRQLLRKLVTDRAAWRTPNSNEPGWLSGIIDYSMVLSAWFTWEALDADTKAWLVSVLNYEAMYYTNQLGTNYGVQRCWFNPPVSVNTFSRDKCNSSGEDNGVISLFLALYSQFIDAKNIENKVNYTAFEEAARVYGFHVATKGEADPLRNLTSKTLMQVNSGEWLFDNHSESPSLAYSWSLNATAMAALGYIVQNKPLPQEYWHNQQEVYNNVTKRVDWQTFLYRTPVGKEICSYTCDPYVTPSCVCDYTVPNFIQVTRRDDWGGDVTWFPTIFSFLSQQKHADASRYPQQAQYAAAIRPDYLAFPIHDRLVLPTQENAKSVFQPYPVRDTKHVLTLSISIAQRHLISYVLQNPQELQ